jgi:hypothetical protein
MPSSRSAAFSCIVESTWGSSTKTMWAPSRAASFFPRPGSTLPAIDSLVVPRQCPTLRHLVAPAELMRQSTNMIAVVADLEFASDQSRDAIACPKVGGVAVGDRPLQQQPKEALLLSGSQPGRPPGRSPDFEYLLANRVSRVAPSHDGVRLAVHPACDFVERQAFIEQCQCPSPASGQDLGGPLGSHTSPPKDSILPSLRRNQ